MALQLISKRRPFANRSLLTFFSTAAEADDGDERSRSSIDSYFSDVKSSLGQQQQQSPNDRVRRPPTTVSVDEIRSKLSSFPRRDAGSSQPSGDSASIGSGAGSAGRISFDLFRTNRSSNPQSAEEEKQSLRLAELQKALGLRPGQVPKPPEIGGMEEDLPSEVFGKEMREREEGLGGGGGASRSRAKRTDFLRSYNAEDLGNKLRMLRPRGKKEQGWFSIEELSGRLMKLREAEEKESDSSSAIHNVGVLRKCLQSLDEVNKKGKETSAEILDIISRSPSYTTLPPKEHLLELYNHPDNMSAAEKMKIELTKVREEFKMTESDCGSTRVQVALLTTKIKYLSSTLHKKDKHSRKGLVEMVHKRKRLLKYLRRTDWDSYCLVLDKLGLRDTPDHKIAHKH